MANFLDACVHYPGDVIEAATRFWQSFTQIDMSSGAIVKLPEDPLSLLPFEEPSFYVRPVYYKLWDIITEQTGMCAAERSLRHALRTLKFTVRKASQSCSSASRLRL